MDYTSRADLLERLPQAVWLSISLLAAGSIAYLIGITVFNLFLHPLRSFPGPILWRISKLPSNYYMFQGTLMKKVEDFHAQYGDAIRIAPNELSYTDAQAWKDVYAHMPGKEEWAKASERSTKLPNGYPNIFGANKEDHSRYRRLLAHAFSDKGLREQETLIKKYVDLLVDRLGEVAAIGKYTNMVDWYNMTVFDVIGDLSWGEAFNSLQDRRVHEWIEAIQGSLTCAIKAGTLHAVGLPFMVPYVVPKTLQALRVKNYKFAEQRVDARIKVGEDRKDFWNKVIIKSANDNEGGEGMAQGEMLNNAVGIVLGGSDTSSTALSAATYLLLKHPKTMEKLVHEVRTTFKSGDEIDLFSVNHLEYTYAVLEESMRLYPPVVFPTAREPPRGGGTIMGKYIPEGTLVNVSSLGANRSAANFARPLDFAPERWLHDAPDEFKNDVKGAFQPFSVGTRNCIGRNLAYAEMKLIMAKLWWHFDFMLDDERTGDWFDQEAWAIWAKKPLWVKLTTATH